MKVMKMMDLKKTFLLSLTLVTVSTVSIRSAEHSVRERRQVSNGGLLTDNEDGFSIKSFIKQLYPDRVKSVREDIKKKNCRFGEIVTIGGEGVRKIIQFSSFTNDEKHGRGGSQSNISLLHRTQL